jgi:hypothetical protein
LSSFIIVIASAFVFFPRESFSFSCPNFSIEKELKIYNALNKIFINWRVFWFKAHQSFITRLSACIWYQPCLCLFSLITYFSKHPPPIPHHNTTGHWRTSHFSSLYPNNSTARVRHIVPRYVTIYCLTISLCTCRYIASLAVSSPLQLQLSLRAKNFKKECKFVNCYTTPFKKSGN